MSISSKFILPAAFFITVFASPSFGQVQFTVNSSGLQTLTYNGQSFLSGPVVAGNVIVPVDTYLTPGGAQLPYGYQTGSLGGAYAISQSVASSDNATYFQQIYRQGLADSYTVKMVFSTPAANTLKADVFVTNNDPTDTLQQIFLEYFMPLATPGLVTNCIGCRQGDGNLIVGTQYNGDAASILYGSWGSVALYSDMYNASWDIGSATNYTSGGRQNYVLSIQNNLLSGLLGPIPNTPIAPIAPGQTGHYDFYFSFGTPSSTPNQLASTGFQAFSVQYPNLVNWPNRAPIARGFLSGGGAAGNSPTNPRGWTFVANIAPQSAFNAALVNWTNNTIATMNAMNPKPQGIIMWDLEGGEFFQPFTYVGNPPQLPNMAPEMNDPGAADAMFAALTAAGYKVGMTLRPSNFQTGAALPATCAFNPYNVSGAYMVSDVFVWTGASYPNRGYFCSAPNTWSQPGNMLPAWQTMSDTDTVTLNNLETKVTYANTRWGATLFYVDSTVYPGDLGQAGTLNFNIFRQLQAFCPTCLFMPEEKNSYYYGATAAYGDSGLGDFGVAYDDPEIPLMYPNAFSVLETFDIMTPPGITCANYNKLLAAVQNGNILLVDGWFPNVYNSTVQQLYAGSASTQCVSGVISSTGTAPSLNAAVVYPNPVVPPYDPIIRVCPGKVDSVDFTIFDVSGHVVNSGTVDGGAGFTPATGEGAGFNCYEYKWTGHKASGAYFAIIHAKGSGTTVKARLKFAVVR